VGRESVDEVSVRDDVANSLVNNPGVWARFAQVPWVRRFLRFPLYHKIVVANSIFVVLVGALTMWLTVRAASEAGVTLHPGLVAGGLLLAVTLTAIANALIVRFALSPLTPIEGTARRVQQGELAARCPPSPLADDDLNRLIQVFNEMLDRVEEAKQRQRELAVMVLQAEERERLWLAKELSDDTAQILAATLLQLRAAARSSGPADAEALAGVRSKVVTALEGVRKVARKLRPPELDELGLGAAVTAHARLLSEVSGVPISCRTPPFQRPLNGETRLALYRIVREALNNAVGHAQPNEVTVRLFDTDGQVVAVVEDDGVGFDTNILPESSGEGLGLVGIYERAAYLGGHVELDSAPGRGTSIRVEIPAGGASSREDIPRRLDVHRVKPA
jgi:two-component system sensor histidine kinase UhpB